MGFEIGENTVLVFPGQGSQQVEMGKALFDAYPDARLIFQEANEILGFDLTQLCFSGPQRLLNATINAQPALLTVSIAILEVLQQRVGLFKPAWAAGHSLGEYSALVAAGSFEFTDCLHLVRERGRLMELAGQLNPGGMAAILGLDRKTVRKVCQQAGDVWVANDNAPGQIVVSGRLTSIQRAMELAKEAGAKKVIPLPVSIASHSQLMSPIVAEFQAVVMNTKIRSPKIAVVGNVTARPLRSVTEIQQELISQLTRPVLWVDSVHYLIKKGVTTFIEIGPGNVLTGLIHRISEKVRCVSVSDPATIARLVE